MKPIISVRNLSKKYIIGENIHGRGARTFRDIFDYKTKRLFRRDVKRSKEDTTIWALKDVSFDVDQGEVVGIIGRNGAGKSTLLKILSRITEPTEGDVTLRGRVASLLEVGTGFNQELTGRENIFLNGSILGMKKSEIKNKFDEIVSFAEIEKFIDTPVKRYSSGMYVRLAFAVAAHLEPEILLVDEVLAVGDVEFQRKCLGKMGSVAKKGRTVLFVSHNMGAITQLCENCIWIDKGMLQESGKTLNIVNSYLKSGMQSCDLAERIFTIDDKKKCQLIRARLLNEANEVSRKYSCDEPIILELTLLVNQTVPGLYCWLDVSRMDGTLVMMSDSFDAPPNPLDNLKKGRYLIKITIPPRTLGAGDYTVNLNFTGMLGGVTPIDEPGIVCHMRLDDFISKRGNRRPGFFSTILPWEISELT